MSFLGAHSIIAIFLFIDPEGAGRGGAVLFSSTLSPAKPICEKEGFAPPASSTIPDAGMGLFAGIDFFPGEIITFYDGPLLQRSVALRMHGTPRAGPVLQRKESANKLLFIHSWQGTTRASGHVFSVLRCIK